MTSHWSEGDILCHRVEINKIYSWILAFFLFINLVFVYFYENDFTNAGVENETKMNKENNRKRQKKNKAK